MQYPQSVYFDGYQNLYVADTNNHRIQFYPRGEIDLFFLFSSQITSRRSFVSPLGSFTGTTIAGSSGSAGSTFAELNYPSFIYVDPNRVMFILDRSNYRVLRWTYSEPRGYLVAGGNGAGSAFNQFSTSYAMFVDNQNNIYISDNANSRVTLWTTANRTWSTLVS